MLAAFPALSPVTCEPGKLKAERVVSVELEVAVMFAAVPVVFWLSVGKLDAMAAATAVPLPYRMPVTVVSNVNTGVVVDVATVPANPLALAIETDVTVPPLLGLVLVIVILPPLGVTEMPVPAT